MALMLLTLLAFAGLGVDVSRWYYEQNREQKAADAAALAGAVHLPSDFAGAQAAALDLAARNGYPVDATTSVAVTLGDKPTRLKVTITRTVANFFGQLVGYGSQTLSRTGVGEYDQPVALGSPNNMLGNQPLDSTESNWANPNITDPEATDPELWLNTAGPSTNKVNGDRFLAGACAGGEFACGLSNAEYQPNGYFFVAEVNVGPSEVGKYVAIQGYDPAFVQTGDTCTDGKLAGAAALSYPDAAQRYATGPGPFCPGDEAIKPGFGNPDTTFTVRGPDATPWGFTDNPTIGAASCGNPLDAVNVADDNANAGSVFTPVNAPLAPLLDNTAPTFNQYTYDVFHRWVTLCEAQLPATTGIYQYVIQVRTGPGAGHNRYALRAGVEANRGQAAASGTPVTLYAAQHLPIYANANAADTKFFLARLLPGTGGRILKLQFYDVGDAAQPGILKILPPPDSNHAGGFPACTPTADNGLGLSTANNGCTLQNVSSGNGYNGRLITMTIPIPQDYTCGPVAQANKCWTRIEFKFPGGVSDTTTWSASIEGDPVRLVQ